MTAAIENGTSHIGLVFYPKSPRNVTIETASYLANFVPETVTTVGLFVNPDEAFLESVLNEVNLNMIQLHGHETPEKVSKIKDTFKLPIMKAIPVASKEDLEAADDYSTTVDYFLFDAKPGPALSELPGGNGLTFDWAILEGYQSPKPYFLAGGLTPDNVGAAIKALNPYGVDVSSGVEKTKENGAGVKDSAKIASFLNAAKSA